MELRQEFDCLHSSPVVCPLDYSIKLGLEFQILGPCYRTLVFTEDSLASSISSPIPRQIAFVVQHLSEFLQQPRQPHLTGAMHVLKYLKGEPSLGILLGNSPTFDLLACCDVDWASCPHSRKSVSGFVMLFGNTLIA